MDTPPTPEDIGAADPEAAGKLLRRPDGRFVPLADLTWHLGCMLTPAEVAEAETYGKALYPMDLLPRAYVHDAPPAPVAYRRRPYRPYDSEEGAEAPPADPARPVYYFRAAKHYGQTKLCVVEVEAITRALAAEPGLRYVLYAGAAPGEHLVFIAEAFPQLELHLVDPAPSRAPSRYGAFPGVAGRIHIRQGLVTDDLVREWAGRAPQTLLISDIRSGDHVADDFEAEVAENMEMQARWWRTGGFAAALLKLRFPYTDGEAWPPVAYPDGEILLQPWGPNTSTEGRLLLLRGAGAGDRDYDPVRIENFYYWLNTIVREWGSFDHGLPLRRVRGLCRCFDCARTVQTFREYAAAFPDARFPDADEHVIHLLKRMVEATSQRFLSPPHGDLVEALAADKRLELARRHGTAFASRQRKRVADRAAAPQHAPPVVQPHLRPPDEGGAPAGAPGRHYDFAAHSRGRGRDDGRGRGHARNDGPRGRGRGAPAPAPSRGTAAAQPAARSRMPPASSFRLGAGDAAFLAKGKEAR